VAGQPLAALLAGAGDEGAQRSVEAVPQGANDGLQLRAAGITPVADRFGAARPWQCGSAWNGAAGLASAGHAAIPARWLFLPWSGSSVAFKRALPARECGLRRLVARRCRRL